MDFTTLQNVSPVYPMYIKQYKDTLLDPNSDVQTKMNSVVQSLNQLSQNENDLVNNWNKVMQWAMNDGLDAAVSTQMTALENSGYFNSLLTSLFNSELGTETLATTSQDIKGAINEVKGVADSNTSALADRALRAINPLLPPYNAKCDGVTDDTAAFQAVFNDAITQKKDVMTVGNILINGTININRDSGDRVIINVFGAGNFIKNNVGSVFSSTNTDRNGGNIRFCSGISFTSVSGAGTTILDGSKLIRIYFDGVDFSNVDSLFNVPRTNVFPYNFIQTIYLSNCTIVGGTGYFINTYTAYDFSFCHNIMEQRDAGFYIEISNSVRIMDNLIEGLTGRVFNGISGRTFIFSDNYMESNGYVTGQPYLEFANNGAYDLNGLSVTIQDNTIIGADSQTSDPNYYAIKFNVQFTNLKIGGNSCDTNLYSVTNAHTITTEFLKAAYQEKIATAGRYCVNTRLPQPVIMGGQSLLRDVRTPFMDSSGVAIVNTGITAVSDVAGHVTLYTTPELMMLMQVATATAQAGFKLRKVHLTKSINYVIGISGYTRLGSGAQPNTLVKVFDSTNALVWSTSLDWQNQASTKLVDNFHSLPAFQVSTDGDYYIQVELDPSGGTIPVGAGLYISGITIQAGTIASFINQYKMESVWNGENLRMGTYVIWIDTAGKPRIKNGYPTSDTDGSVCNLGLSGVTASRPTTGLYAGMPYYDTTLNKPIWFKTGTTWIDATGTTV